MKWLFLFLFCGSYIGLAAQAVQNHIYNIRTTAGVEISPEDVQSYFKGQDWLEYQSLSEPVALNEVYQKTAFKRELPKKSVVKKYQQTYSSWIEERKCLDSPYIDKPVRANMTSRFGYRTHPMSGRRHIHAGIDFRGRVGTPVLAGSAGVIKTVGRKGAYGKTIIIDHGNSYTTLYGHLSGYAVKEGEWVNLGQTIGYIGKTGRATGPHLHFEVRCHNVPLNPIAYLGKTGKVAEVRFKKRSRYPRFTAKRSPAAVIRDPNYYTRLINLQKLKKLQSK